MYCGCCSNCLPDPESDFQVGEDRTRQLFIDYSKYLDSFAR